VLLIKTVESRDICFTWHVVMQNYYSLAVHHSCCVILMFFGLLCL